VFQVADASILAACRAVLSCEAIQVLKIRSLQRTAYGNSRRISHGKNVW